MKNEKRFNNTINVLVKAYFNGTLEYTQPCGCAVGNIIADALGLKVEWVEYENFKSLTTPNRESGDWVSIINTSTGTLTGLRSTRPLDKIAKTGYTPQELANIEFAFYLGVTLPDPNHPNDTMKRTEKPEEIKNYEGLMSVVDALMIIHEANKEEVSEAKKLFVKPIVELIK